MKIFMLSFIVIFFVGCSKNIPSHEQRVKSLYSLFPDNSYEVQRVETKSYSFNTVHKVKKECSLINIYFEGDGLSWITRSIISSDPTPLNPVGFKLMLEDDSFCSIYISRVCQYVQDSRCSKRDWTSHRFSPKIINATSETMDQIKKQYNNKSFNLIGYSGGGAVAVLLTNKRKDIKSLVTVAGNLDTDLWTTYHNISALNGSLNPSHNIKNLQDIQQYHLVGTNDRIIPKDIIYSYISKFKDHSKIKYKLVEATHTKGWEQYYKDFFKKYF